MFAALSLKRSTVAPSAVTVTGTTHSKRFATFVPDGDIGKFAKELSSKLSADFTGAMKLLRDKAFQDLLVNYPRPKRGLIKDFTTQDEVTSQWLIRDGNGREYKPEDYLAEFARFVRENPAHVEAIGILLERPKEWSTDALNELRHKLKSNTLRFTEDDLQKAHQLRYHKALADIISMVKHAADEQEPLLTAAERANRAMAMFTAGKQFSEQQRRWLDLIQAHLVANLSVERDDFDAIPSLEHEGGWTAANRAFGGRLAMLLTELNEALAA